MLNFISIYLSHLGNRMICFESCIFPIKGNIIEKKHRMWFFIGVFTDLLFIKKLRHRWQVKRKSILYKISFVYVASDLHIRPMCTSDVRLQWMIIDGKIIKKQINCCLLWILTQKSVKFYIFNGIELEKYDLKTRDWILKPREWI